MAKWLHNFLLDCAPRVYLYFLHKRECYLDNHYWWGQSFPRFLYEEIRYFEWENVRYWWEGPIEPVGVVTLAGWRVIGDRAVEPLAEHELHMIFKEKWANPYRRVIVR